MSSKHFGWILALSLLLAGCQPAVTASPYPTQVLVRVQMTPTLHNLVPLLNDCARQQQNLGIAVDERPVSGFDPAYPGISLRWGAPASVTGFAVQLGADQLVVVVHPSSPIQQLSRAQLKAVFSSSARTWDAFLQPKCKDCAADSSQHPLSGKEIHAWAYNPGDDIQQLFQSQALGQPIKNGSTYLAPDPEAMRQAISADPAAIGFLPGRYLNSSVKAVQVTGLENQQPILALAATEPQGETRQWLGCLTNALK